MPEEQAEAKNTPAHQRLTLDDVLSSALDLLNAQGIEQVTLRGVARRLGVHLNSVSFQVKSKARLYELLADRILGEVSTRDLPLGPRARVVELAGRYRRALLSHRDGARIVMGTTAVERNTLTVGDIMVGALLEGGADKVTCTRSFWAISYFILGIAQEEQNWPDNADYRLRKALEIGSYPTLEKVSAALTEDSFDERFRFGMDALLSAAGI
ncbi:TetR/AcrR family transcriptional regulator C-terminal domain-containing protein [Nocardiopsis mangrovi]|uniref:TetR/AcrR family transcriptional regulator C-terminal domain-containing protein n=1 Tax=Nocardiopsis mangrovi TaxID=1179818 RepID=A0ABV9DX37_9ACTN